MKIKRVFVTFFILLNSALYCQGKIKSFNLTDTSVTIENNLVCKSHAIYIRSIRTIKRLFPKERVIEKRDKEFNNWNYYLKGAGIEFRCSNQMEDIDDIHVYYKKNDLLSRRIRRKLGTYNDSLNLNGIAITSMTTFGFLKDKLSKGCCYKAGGNNIHLEYEGIGYTLIFEDESDSALISLLVVNW